LNIPETEARRAIAEAMAVDEVQTIRNKADAMRVYAKQAQNRQLEVDAAEIRLRAERRLGELIIWQKQTVGLNPGSAGTLRGRNSSGGAVLEPLENKPPTLAEAGIDKKLSMRAQKLAAVRVARQCRVSRSQPGKSALALSAAAHSPADS
jgi:hypothetical protein